MGLTNGENYESRLLAVNARGVSAYSATAAAEPGSVATAPRSLNLSLANAAFDAGWVAPADNGGSVITAYILLYRTPNNDFPRVSATNDCAGITSNALAGCQRLAAGNPLRLNVSGLTNGLRYDASLQAQTANGLGLAAIGSVVPGAVPAAPSGADLNLRAMNLGFRAVWSAPATNGYPLTKYIFVYKNNASGAYPALMGAGASLGCADRRHK